MYMHKFQASQHQRHLLMVAVDKREGNRQRVWLRDVEREGGVKKGEGEWMKTGQYLTLQSFLYMMTVPLIHTRMEGDTIGCMENTTTRVKCCT